MTFENTEVIPFSMAFRLSVNQELELVKIIQLQHSLKQNIGEYGL